MKILKLLLGSRAYWNFHVLSVRFLARSSMSRPWYWIFESETSDFEIGDAGFDIAWIGGIGDVDDVDDADDTVDGVSSSSEGDFVS